MPSASSVASPSSSSPSNSATRPVFLPLAVAALALAAALAFQPQLQSRLLNLFGSPAPSSTSSATAPAMTVSPITTAAAAVSSSAAFRTPVHFISHGGPPTLFETTHPAHKQWAKTGRAIQRVHTALQPQGGLRGIVIVSAHWESENDAIQMNTAKTPLIYDFYGFPKHYYNQSFDHEWLEKDGLAEVGQALTAAGVKWQGVQGRGLDHGAWVPAKIMFPDAPPAPLVQLSLPRPSSSAQLEGSLALGRALAPLRERGYLILASGQPVHNLRDLFGRSGALGPRGYGGPFLERVGEWVKESEGDSAELKQVRQWPSYKSAVPEDDHFAPLAVAVGAGTAYGGKAAVEFEQDEGPLGWGFYSWSE